MIRSNRGFVWTGLAAASVCILALCAGESPAEPAVQPAAGGKVTMVQGSLLQQTADKKSWKPLKLNDALPADCLAVAFPFADIDSTDGAVQLQLRADIGRHGPLHVFESGVRLHANDKFDVDFSLERGIVVIRNLRAKGESRVRVRLQQHVWEVTLQEPGARVGLELIARHEPGIRPSTKEGEKPFKAEDRPALTVYVLMLEGKAQLNTGKELHALTAPPGPSLLLWDSVAGSPGGVQRLEALPDWIKKPEGEVEKKIQAVTQVTGKLNTMPVDRFLAACASSNELPEQLIGLVVAAAVDDLPRIAEAINNEKSAPLRDASVLVLRHWIGRDFGNDQRLYEHLVNEKKASVRQAKGVLQLLYGFSETDLAHPEVYELLLVLLSHERLAVRELARWHLYRLVPDGRKIEFDAAASKEKRDAAVAQWKKLIPDGALPPRELKSPPK